MKDTRTAYITTIGLNIAHPAYRTPRLVRVGFEVYPDKVIATVNNAETLDKMRKIPSLTITREQFAELPEDPYNDVVFARAAFDLFGCEI